MAGHRHTTHPIVYSNRPEVVEAVRGELRGLGCEGIQVPKNTEACIELLVLQPGVMLVIDWAVGAQPVNQVLGAVRGFFKIETRPIFLLIPEINAEIVAAGIEYGVAQVHSGPISRVAIRTCLEELLAEDEDTKAVRDGLVQVASARRNDDWAFSTPILDELHRQYPGNKRILVELAENLIHSGDWKEAMTLLTPLITDPPYVRALHLMGRCYMQAKDFDSALRLLGRAKLINPDNSERLIELGDAFLANDQAGEALSNYKEALALDQGSAAARAGLGTSLLMTGEVNEALQLFKDSSGPRELASIFNSAAILAMRFGRFDQGMQLYRSALKSLGRDDSVGARLLFNMGLGYKRWGKLDKAKVCFEKSMALDPSFVKVAKYKEGLPTPAASDDEMSLHEAIVPSARRK